MPTRRDPRGGSASSSHRLTVAAALVDGAILPGDVELTGARISGLGLPVAAGATGLAVAGLWDLQVNGFAGVDVMEAGVEDLEALATALPAHGVTSFLPTLITAEASRTSRALQVVAEVVRRQEHAGAERSAARVLGAHLEGPFLSPRRLGTHPAAHRRDPDPRLLERWRAEGPVVALTLAPELPGALDLVAGLAGDGVLVGVGHSDATAAQAHAAFDAGARAVTHLFNAMSPLHHREPGVPGAALARRDVVVGLVVDGHHLAPDVVRTVWAAARGRVLLVSDATAAAGLGDGRHHLAGLPVDVVDGAVRNAAGDLAGSATHLDAAVRGSVALGVEVPTALGAATSVPAGLLGLDGDARLLIGAPADLVVLEEDLTVRETWVGGHRHPTEAHDGPRGWSGDRPGAPA